MEALSDLVRAGVSAFTVGFGGLSVDPTGTASVFVDDFLFQSTETGEIGQGWNITNGSVLAQACEQSHPGCIDRRTGTTANQVALMVGGAASGTAVLRFDEFDDLVVIWRLPFTNADFILRAGLMADFGTLTPTHGVYVERLAADTSYYGVSRNNSVETRTAALKAQGTVWNKTRIRRISATQVGFTMDGGSEVTLSTNIPDAADTLNFGVQLTPTTTTARDVILDWFALKTVAITR
jgi:hypothetical protein